MIRKFRFYLTYADIIGDLTDVEAGQFIKKLCRFMFADETLNDDANDKVESILMLISEELEEQKRGDAPARKNKSFAFLKVYANIFYSLKDAMAGLLIKRVCDFMFGGNRMKDKDCSKIDSYFNLLKGELTKSKNKASNGRMERVTLDKIYRDFPNILKPLDRSSTLFTDVDMRDLYAYIAQRTQLQSMEMFDIMCRYLDDIANPRTGENREVNDSF